MISHCPWDKSCRMLWAPAESGPSPSSPPTPSLPHTGRGLLPASEPLLRVWPCLEGFPSSSDGKASACNAEDWVQSLVRKVPGREGPLEKEMATHSSILAWIIPWTKVVYCPWSHKELDMTKRLTLSFMIHKFQIADMFFLDIQLPKKWLFPFHRQTRSQISIMEIENDSFFLSFRLYSTLQLFCGPSK